MVDWSKLKPSEGDQRRSFEEFCYQVAKNLFGDHGAFTSVDDSGGGDGVEFYLTLPDGTQWGWQAKFYHPDSRLSTGNRKASIRGSLVKACQEHLRLKRWFLCTPTNLTPAERRWFEETLPNAIPEGGEVELEHWGDSDFSAWLSEPRFVGKRHYFFGELELGLDWFRRHFDQQRASLRDKFNPALHTETSVDARVHAMLGDNEQARALREWQVRLQAHQTSFNEELGEFESQDFGLNWGDAKEPILESAAAMRNALEAALNVVEQALERLEGGQIRELQQTYLEEAFNHLRSAYKAYMSQVEQVDVNGLPYVGDPEIQRETVREAERVVHSKIPGWVASFLKELQDVRESLDAIRLADLHILGDAGTGKTHITCHVCEQRLERNVPALFVRGSAFTSSEPLTTQLLALLDVPATYSWGDLLSALDTAAEAYRTRIPIIIDGLNESVVGGAFSPVWREHLTEVVEQIKAHPNLVLITSYRPTYEDAIWPSGKPANRVIARGFTHGDDLEEAIRRYFAFYNIVADLTGAPLEQFRHPIYLRLFCETKNPNRGEAVHVYLGEQTLFEVFDEYFRRVNRTLTNKLNLRPTVNVIDATVGKLAEHLWINHTRTMPLDDLALAVDGAPLDRLAWEGSRTKALEDEGLLVCRDLRSGEEVVAFTYDLIAGYAVAHYLLDTHEGTIEAFLTSEQAMTGLFEHGETVSDRLLGEAELHPLYDDIRRSLAAQMPARTGRYLHDIVRQGEGFGVGINALFEMQPGYVNADCLNLVTGLFSEFENRKALFQRAQSTVGHVGHPLNITFWRGLLRELPMPARDLSWSEHVRYDDEFFGKFLVDFEAACRRPGAAAQSEARLHLLAEYAMWLLTTTVRPLRDKATRALYYYGRRYPEPFLNLLRASFGVDDPYIFERMLAAAYGIAMARQFDSKDRSFVSVSLPKYGRTIFDFVFAEDAPRPTPHVLTRDYAKRTVELALAHHPTQLLEEEMRRLRRPLSEVDTSNWVELEPRGGHYFGGGGEPLHMDFANYTLGTLVPNRENYDFDHPEYGKVYRQINWRIHDLGYTQEQFENIDARLAEATFRQFSRESSGLKTDRYGKKYAWIAFFELYGLRKDLGLLEGAFSSPPERPYDTDIDPSFPEPVTECYLIQENLLGDFELPLEAWLEDGGVPDLTPYLIVDALLGEDGPWVMLDGYVNQEDQTVERGRFTFIRGLCVAAQEAEAILGRLAEQDLGGRWLPEIGEDHFTYAGEIPWSDTFGSSDEHELAFVIGHKRVVDDVPKPIEFVFDDEAGTLTLEGFGETVVAEHVVDEYERYEVLLPVWEVGWSDDTSAANPGYSVQVPAKQIAEHLDLCNQPQTFDLYEKNGRRASVSLRYKDEAGNRQHFVFLRKDFLDRYLFETAGALVWAVWGEREKHYKSLSGASHIRGSTYKVFKDIKTYSELLDRFRSSS